MLHLQIGAVKPVCQSDPSKVHTKTNQLIKLCWHSSTRQVQSQCHTSKMGVLLWKSTFLCISSLEIASGG